MPPAQRPGVYLEGLADLRRVLKRIDRNLEKGIGQSLREIGKRVRDVGREGARRFRDTGALEKSIRYSSTAKKSSVYSNLDYAPVHEWGGTISPRGVPIRIPRRQYLTNAVSRSRPWIDDQLEGLLDELADWWERL